MAKRKNKAKSTSKEWDAFEAAVLSSPAAASKRGRMRAAAADSGGSAESEDEVLRRLAQRSRLLRGRQDPIGNVVFLHGITGSDLAVSSGAGKVEDVWVAIGKLIRGGIEDLELTADGKSERNGKQVRATGVNQRFYARAVLALRAQWDVEPYAYDWRKDIDVASEGLAEFIAGRFAGQPVHLVAHSMGGLVARNMIRRHPKLWEAMRDPSLIRGGRLIMLGTPNYGSYAIAQVLTGTDPMMKWLGRFDVMHNLTELLKITNSFLGTYMLLPAFEKLSPALQRLYESGTWGSSPGVSQAHLDRTFQFYQSLDTPETVDGSRMVYVAGYNQTTISSVRVVAPGEFEYDFTRDGDGRVPHALGLLDGVTTLYVDELHGDLARNEEVLRSLDELLQKGTTKQLPKTPVVRKAPAVPGAPGSGTAPTLRAYRSGPDRAGLDVLAPLAEAVRADGNDAALSPDDRAMVTDSLIHVALGARSPMATRSRPQAEAERSTERVVRKRDRLRLRVGVRFGAIEDFEASAVIVGHYRGIKPVNAIGAIDKRLGGWIARAVKRGMIAGHVGETFFVPTKGTKVAADGVVVAGMGDFGRFSAASLRRLMANVAQGLAALGAESAATVLVGAGVGNLDEETALRTLLEGFGSGLLELHAERGAAVSLQTLWIVEYDPKRFTALGRHLEELVPRLKAVGIDPEVVRPSAADRARAVRVNKQRAATQLSDLRTRPSGSSGQRFDEVRLTVEYDGDKKEFRFSALSDTAVIAARKIEITREKAEDAARALAEASSRAEQLRFGRLLFNYVIPEDFDSLFESGQPVRLTVDPTSAALPWEMACFRDGSDAGRVQWFGTDRGLTRQFKTLLARTPGVIAPRNERVRALVIADPASDPDWQLPGARAEGRRVAKLLQDASGKDFAKQHAIDIEVVERIGAAECDPTELQALLTSGDFDLVHFAGHGDYNKDDPAQSGWVLDANRFVSAADIFRARRVPWLVVANACYSGALRSGEAYPSLEVAVRGASIAEAFMERGVQNYLGTGWTVDDAQALAFAETFYAELLGNSRLGDAVNRARTDLFKMPSGSTWGAYQFYGDSDARLLPRVAQNDDDGQAPAMRPAHRRTATRRSARKRGKRKS